MAEELASAPGRPGLVLPVRVDVSGVSGPTRDQARGPHWRRTSRGFYVPSSVTNDAVEQRILEASVVVPARHAITGWAALRWQGGRWFTGTLADGSTRPVVVMISTSDIRPQPGIAVSGEGTGPHHIRVVDGVPVTDPWWSTSFEMRYATSKRAAVAVLDMAAFSDLVSVEEQIAFLTPGQNSWTGIPQARWAGNLARENSWSPQEVMLRLIWTIDAGRPEPLCNQPIFDRQGRLIGTPDLLDPESGVAGEYDGDHHLARDQRRRDIARESLFRDHGLEPVIAVAPDISNPRSFVERLHQAYRRCRRTSPDDRSWTIDQPPWWIPTETVAQRRALPPDQRARLLAKRAA